MPFPSRAFSEWTRKDLDGLIADPPATESARLDFKADCVLLSEDKEAKEKARRDILVDVASLANGIGGALLIGVREGPRKGAPPCAVKIHGVQQPERLKQAIESLVATYLDVRPAALEYHTIPYEDDRSVLAVLVPANTYGLSMVTYNGVHQFRIRRGTDNRPMTADEIEYRFGQFAKLHDSAESELRRIRTRLETGTGIRIIWFAGVPLGRSRDHVPVDLQRIRGVLEKSSYFAAYPQRQRSSTITPRVFAPHLSPSLRGVKLARHHGGMATLELQRDGVFVFARKRENLKPKGEGPTAAPLSLWMVYECLASGLHAFADIQREFGIGGASVVQSGLYGASRAPIRRGSQLDLLLEDRPLREGERLHLDPVMLGDEWDPKAVFLDWALQFANALELEEPIALPPWVDQPRT